MKGRDSIGVRMGRNVFLLLLTTMWMTSATIVFHVAEEQPSGVLVGNVKDASNVSREVDEDVRDRLQFHILSADGLRITSIFSINSRTGAIFTNAMIDREQLCDITAVCQLEFDVTVKTNVSFIKLLAVSVIIDDINDNAPAFPKPQITLTVSESATIDSKIPISGALDRDSGLSADISYSLQVSSVFGLQEERQLDGSTALKLVVQQSLDREAVSAYSFLILASDGQGPDSRTGTLTVDVVVSDVNDNVPKFTKDTFNLTVMETAPVGTVFGNLLASDGDIGNNGKLSFKFSLRTQSEVTELFSLNNTSGELSVASSLQYKSGGMFQCVVEVMDHGVPPQMSQAILRIHVADAGNTPPKLDLILAEPMFGDQSTKLSEDVQVGTFVGTLKVEDLDSGSEGQVNCSSQNPHFSLQDLETNRYGIVVSQALDREEEPDMDVGLICSDNGQPRLTSSTVFSVIVSDVNDNAPEFKEAVFRGLLTENGAGQQHVTRVTADDRDDNNALTYFLDSQSTSFFTVDPLSGIITTQRSFDRELTPFITLTIYAVDSGPKPLTGSATVSIRIADVNDNSPYVNRTDYYISKNMHVGNIFNIGIADQDEGLNATVQMYMDESAGADLTPFRALSNGSIMVQSAMDREQQSLYEISVVLRDQGSPPLSSTATLTIHVVDNNDHAPLFDFPTPDNKSVVSAAGIPVGSHICRVSAKDSDLGSNGHVVYFISGGDGEQWFGINNQTGDVFLIRSLFNAAGSALHLRVSASDLGIPPRTSHALLEIHVRSNNNSYLAGSSANDEDKHIVIAGVITGITFVIAVVVIAVIIHMRNSDLRRRTAARESKGVRRDEGAVDNAKNLSVLSQSSVLVADGSDKTKPVNGFPSVEMKQHGHDVSLDNPGFQSLPLAGLRDHKDAQCGDTVDSHIDPTFVVFTEGRNRFVSEDHNSDTSGETTTCDSGRGASDEEAVFPISVKASGSADHPPRVPPREPLSAAGQWTRDARVVSTNWSQPEPQLYLTDDPSAQLFMDDTFDVDASSSAGDFRMKARKGQLKVRFSFDDGDSSRSQNSVLPHGFDNQAFYGHVAQPNVTASHHDFDHNGQPYVHNRADNFHDAKFSQRSFHNHPMRNRQNENVPSKSSPAYQQNNDTDRFGREMQLNPESLYPRTDRFPRKQRAQAFHPGWERVSGEARNSESLSSLPQSVDDDFSTTTSGSYSIDADDAANVSLEC